MTLWPSRSCSQPMCLRSSQISGIAQVTLWVFMCWAGKTQPFDFWKNKRFDFSIQEKQQLQLSPWGWVGQNPQVAESTLEMNREVFCLSGSYFTCTFLSCQSWEDIKTAKSKAPTMHLEELPYHLDSSGQGKCSEAIYVGIWAVTEFGRIINFSTCLGLFVPKDASSVVGIIRGNPKKKKGKLIGTQVRKAILS